MDLVAGKILVFMMILARVGAFFASAPVLSWNSIPLQVKLSVAIFVSIFIAMIVPLNGQISDEMRLIEMMMLLGYEVIYGLAFGFIAMFIFSVVRVAGRIMERQMGLSMANMLDPLSGENGSPVGLMMEMIFILLFLSANGHHLLLFTIFRSYDAFPIASVPDVAMMAESLIVATSTMLMLALKLSAPILAVFLLVMVILAVLARISPQMNILFISMPLRVGIGMLIIGIFLPFILGFIQQFSLWMEKLMPT